MKKDHFSKRKIFLETSAQISRLSGDEENERKILSILCQLHNLNSTNFNKKLMTSSTVYVKFLNTFVKDILLVRELVKDLFLEKKKFELNLNILKRHIENELKHSNRSENSDIFERLLVIVESIEEKYKNINPIETKSLIRFLDNYARELMFDDFFKIRIDGREFEIDKTGSNYLRKIGCVVEEPLQTECQARSDELCVFGIFENSGEKCLHEKCLSSKSPITKCKLENIRCEIDDFLRSPKLFEKFEKLIEEAKKEFPFSTTFKNRNLIWIDLLKDIDCSNFPYCGDKCFNHFLEMLTLFQCPDDALILSNDKNFKELGKVIGKSENFLNFEDFMELSN